MRSNFRQSDYDYSRSSHGAWTLHWRMCKYRGTHLLTHKKIGACSQMIPNRRTTVPVADVAAADRIDSESFII